MLSSGWETYEVCQKDAHGNFTITPFAAALAASGIMLAQPIIKMRQIQEIGWPEARLRLKDNYGHRLIVKKDEIIWLLKCKPTCWRLYFYVREKEKRIIYVHAVCKKKDKEHPRDAIEARRVADEIRPGGSAITIFEFPSG
jgi:hypothetical protein